MTPALWSTIAACKLDKIIYFSQSRHRVVFQKQMLFIYPPPPHQPFCFSQSFFCNSFFAIAFQGKLRLTKYFSHLWLNLNLAFKPFLSLVFLWTYMTRLFLPSGSVKLRSLGIHITSFLFYSVLWPSLISRKVSDPGSALHTMLLA